MLHAWPDLQAPEMVMRSIRDEFLGTVFDGFSL